MTDESSNWIEEILKRAKEVAVMLNQGKTIKGGMELVSMLDQLIAHYASSDCTSVRMITIFIPLQTTCSLNCLIFLPISLKPVLSKFRTFIAEVNSECTDFLYLSILLSAFSRTSARSSYQMSDLYSAQ